MRTSSVVCVVLSLAFQQGHSTAGDWSQFRGPNGQGRAQSSSLPLRFGATQGVAWKAAIPGKGWSSPVVLDDGVWMTSAASEGRSLHAICVDLKTGALRHDVEVFAPSEPAPINPKNSHASPTPAVADGRVYAHFGAMGTACLDAETGRILWRNQELVIDHKEGPGSSAILFEDLLIVNCDGQDRQYVVGLSRETGRIVWKTKRSAPLRENPDFRKAYSTPVLVDVAGQPQLVSSGADQVNAYDPRTGRELWRVRYTGFSNVPVPLVGKGFVYVVTDFPKPELWAIRTNGSGDVTDTHIVWKLARQVGSSPSPILVDDRIYLMTDQGVLTCVEIVAGKVIWQKRLGGTYSSSLILAGGRLFAASEKGQVAVIEPADEPRVVAVNDFGERILATPAVLDSGLLVRTEQNLYRIESGAASSSGAGGGR